MRLIALMMVSVIVLSACGNQVLYSGLDEKEVNEMISLLYRAGISASKVSDDALHYSITTKEVSFSAAVELLKANGYPKNNFESIGDVFKKEGFVSSPLEERARLGYAQSQELAQTIENIDGVVVARVHLALPEENKLTNEVKPASASVFIKHRRGIDLKSKEAQIKALLVNSIANLPYEKVTVAMFTSDPVQIELNINQEKQKSIDFDQYRTQVVIGSIILVFGLVFALYNISTKRKSIRERALTKGVKNSV